jgi:ABC-2 type transport system ATP-binding protein
MDLCIDSLSKTYPNGVHALKNVSLTIGPGMFGLLGPNGAGKSTLMRTLATLQDADSGSALLGDIDVLRQKDRVRQLLGYLPQDFGVYPKVTAYELLNHFAVLKGLSNARQRKDVVNALLQQTNLHEVRHKHLGGFSGGMKQRFGIAQALLGNPRLIIVDEPTAGLDPQERVRFHNLLSEIGENVIVILSTHIVSDVSDLCQQMAIINGGQVLLTGEPLQAIRAIEGKVWKRFIEKSELAEQQKSHRVISSRLFSGRTLIHVFAETRPAAGFESSPPDLEDVYFATIAGCIGGAPGSLALKQVG